jgi:hypothetical protein
MQKKVMRIATGENVKKNKHMTETEKAAAGRKAADAMRTIFGLRPMDEEKELHNQYPQGIPIELAHGCSTTLTRKENP